MFRVDPCTTASARHACEHWHYSGSLPAGRLVKFGVWESDQFVGAVIFGRGAAPFMARAIGVHTTEACELVRVAMRLHVTPVTKIVAIALRSLKKTSPGLRAVVSFADSGQGHHGGIYQAGNWVYVGESVTHVYVVNGEEVHPKTMHSRYGKGGQSIPWLRANVDPDAERRVCLPKHKYVYPLTREMAERLKPLSLPYPQRAADPTGETRLPAVSRRFDSDPAASYHD